jgi:hypothetical protein
VNWNPDEIAFENSRIDGLSSPVSGPCPIAGLGWGQNFSVRQAHRAAQTLEPLQGFVYLRPISTDPSSNNEFPLNIKPASRNPVVFLWRNHIRSPIPLFRASPICIPELASCFGSLLANPDIDRYLTYLPTEHSVHRQATLQTRAYLLCQLPFSVERVSAIRKDCT